MTREITYAAAIREAQDQLMAADPDVYVLGLGVPTPTGVFGTTTGLAEKYGATRVLDLPAAENGMTGMALGTAISGMRPIMVHHRVDFAVLSMEPIVNQAAKWHFMYGGQGTAPLTIRMIIGRGWGQGPQHSQSLQAWFAHVPGLQVLMPATPSDAKGLLASAVLSDAPTVILEHRWLYGLSGPVHEDLFTAPIGVASVRRQGTDITLVATSYMVIECLKAAEILDSLGVSAEVVDVRTVSPLDGATILESVAKTGRLVVADTGHTQFGITSEIVSIVSETLLEQLKSRPVRLGLPTAPTPTSPALAKRFYPTARDLVYRSMESMGLPHPAEDLFLSSAPADVPSRAFTGPY